ncbi:MAG: hypothetical protein A3D92_05235 [Bacteroidetes bacterium RIFCSPHIGHO2_02_FULL_44_7]|nr:MAG: hypothetical protein A3D92_05235 [Bacteroidetes bacterium RIFCSPHIGHO2_02_FULL_44_7]
MKNRLASILLTLLVSFSTQAQIPNGSIATDFTLTDIYGTPHNLYQYLDEGKVVYLKFFACHCPSCWAYHNSGTLENLYQNYGPEGSAQIQVLMLENDEFNADAFYGLGGYTQGDWTLGNSIPMIDVEGADRTIFTDYNMTYYPMVYKVCPDKTTTLISTSYNTSQLYQFADECPGTLGLEEEAASFDVFVDNVSLELVVEQPAAIKSLRMFSASGQEIQLGNLAERLDISKLDGGVYFVQLETEAGVVVKKVFISF